MGSGTKKKMAKHASVTTHRPPWKYFDFTTNLPLTGMGKYTGGANDSLCPGRQQSRRHLGLPEWFPEVCVMLFMVCFLYQKGKQPPKWPQNVCIMAYPAHWFIPWQGPRHGLLAGHTHSWLQTLQIKVNNKMLIKLLNVKTAQPTTIQSPSGLPEPLCEIPSPPLVLFSAETSSPLLRD